jgi:hypothetical protein
MKPPQKRATWADNIYKERTPATIEAYRAGAKAGQLFATLDPFIERERTPAGWSESIKDKLHGDGLLAAYRAYALGFADGALEELDIPPRRAGA